MSNTKHTPTPTYVATLENRYVNLHKSHDRLVEALRGALNELDNHARAYGASDAKNRDMIVAALASVQS